MNERENFVSKLIDLVEAYSSAAVPVSLYAKDKRGVKTLPLTKDNFREMKFPLVIFPLK